MREACVCDHNGGRTFSRHSPALARVAQAAPARLPLRVAQTLKSNAEENVHAPGITGLSHADAARLRRRETARAWVVINVLYRYVNLKNAFVIYSRIFYHNQRYR